MDIINHIINIKEAKKYFHSMDCSHFHMAREYPERYSEYLLLKIDKDLEHIWRKEYLEEKKTIIESCEDVFNIQNSIREIETAIFSDYDACNLEYLIKAVENREKFMDSFCKLVISESIIRILEQKFIANNNTNSLIELVKRLSEYVVNHPNDIFSERLSQEKYDITIYSKECVGERAKRVSIMNP